MYECTHKSGWAWDSIECNYYCVGCGNVTAEEEIDRLRQRVAELESKLCGYAEYNKGLRCVVDIQKEQQRACEWDSHTNTTGCGLEYDDGYNKYTHPPYKCVCGGKVEIKGRGE